MRTRLSMKKETQASSARSTGRAKARVDIKPLAEALGSKFEVEITQNSRQTAPVPHGRSKVR